MWLLVLAYIPTIPKCFYIAVCRAAGRISRAAAVLTTFAVIEVGAAMAGGLRGGLVGLSLGLLAVALAEALYTTPAVLNSAFGGGRHAVQHHDPAIEPLQDATVSGLAGSNAIGPAVNETDGQRRQTVGSETALSPGIARTVPASYKLGYARQIRAQRSPASPRVQPAGTAWSASSHPMTMPSPSLTRTTWTVVVSADRMYFDTMIGRTLSGHIVVFPRYSDAWRFRLVGDQMRIGRSSPVSGLAPEIDLSGPPIDPGVSRLHAILVRTPDDNWAVLDPGSANGTLLNGRKIAVGNQITLHDGDRINVGAWTMITVHCDRASSLP